MASIGAILGSAGRLAREFNSNPKGAFMDTQQRAIGFGMRQMSRSGGIGAFRGDGSKVWGMNAVKAGGINAGIGGVYGGTTADDNDRVGGAFRGAIMGAGLGAAARGGLQLAKRSEAAERYINKHYDNIMSKGTSKYRNLRTTRMAMPEHQKFAVKEVMRQGESIRKQMQKQAGNMGAEFQGPFSFINPGSRGPLYSVRNPYKG